MTTNITNDSYIAHAVDAVTQSYAHCLRIVDREIDKDNGTVESVKFVAMFIFRKNEDGKFVTVDVKPVQPLKTSVTLADLKAHPLLSQMKVVKQVRLSVSPVTDEEWAEVCAIGGV